MTGEAILMAYLDRGIFESYIKKKCNVFFFIAACRMNRNRMQVIGVANIFAY